MIRLHFVGGSYTVNRLPIRLIACAWSLAAFVFVQAYNSTLITYVLAPNNSPLVKSFHELAERSDLVLWMRRAGTLENMLYSVSKCLIKIGIFEKLIVSLFSN